ncbi:sensor histidine kinase [Bacillus sp. FJAT-45037]|uniref:sensor histidine kinase n=1 Tax=Bacillus sp. FJAT-45037 TaxID=2011007 RepID=UPI000C232982|nr:HAMP domain-containing sensor histidine kinase [Bacillus sp. FJAT-45037]
MKKRLARLHWQFIRHNLLIAALVVLFVSFMMTYQEDRGLLLLIDIELFYLPILIWLLLLVLIFGLTAGAMQARPITKRIDSLVHGVARYERGTFSHRLILDGDDELTELTERMNRMAAQIEQQIASLQRLSTERAAMQETMKKAAVTEERQRLARDLHDAVSQQLFAISMMTAALKSSPIKEDSQLEIVEKMANTAQAEMRALLLHLRPAHLEGKSLEEGAGQLFKELQEKHKVDVTFSMNVITELPKGIEDQIYRLIQEAISNILRHSKATQVEFKLHESEKEIQIRIVDNGVGFDPEKVDMNSYGLLTMKERMNEVGGVLNLLSAPSQGTQLEAKIPIAWRGEEVND